MSFTCKTRGCDCTFERTPGKGRPRKYCSDRCARLHRQGRGVDDVRGGGFKHIRITPAMRRYLAAFDAWLELDTPDRADAKADALAELIAGRI